MKSVACKEQCIKLSPSLLPVDKHKVSSNGGKVAVKRVGKLCLVLLRYDLTQDSTTHISCSAHGSTRCHSTSDLVLQGSDRRPTLAWQRYVHPQQLQLQQRDIGDIGLAAAHWGSATMG